MVDNKINIEPKKSKKGKKKAVEKSTEIDSTEKLVVSEKKKKGKKGKDKEDVDEEKEDEIEESESMQSKRPSRGRRAAQRQAVIDNSDSEIDEEFLERRTRTRSPAISAGKKSGSESVASPRSPKGRAAKVSPPSPRTSPRATTVKKVEEEVPSVSKKGAGRKKGAAVVPEDKKPAAPTGKKRGRPRKNETPIQEENLTKEEGKSACDFL